MDRFVVFFEMLVVIGHSFKILKIRLLSCIQNDEAFKSIEEGLKFAPKKSITPKKASLLKKTP